MPLPAKPTGIKLFLLKQPQLPTENPLKIRIFPRNCEGRAALGDAGMGKEKGRPQNILREGLEIFFCIF